MIILDDEIKGKNLIQKEMPILVKNSWGLSYIRVRSLSLYSNA